MQPTGYEGEPVIVEDGHEQIRRNENQDQAPGDPERYPCSPAHLATAITSRKLTQATLTRPPGGLRQSGSAAQPADSQERDPTPVGRLLWRMLENSRLTLGDDIYRRAISSTKGQTWH